MRLRNTIKETVQCDLMIGGRGFDSIESVQHYTSRDRDKYTLCIDTRHGPREVLSLNMADNELKCMGDSRTGPFLKLGLSANAAQKIRRAIESEYEVEER